jgi:hypothetical protein
MEPIERVVRTGSVEVALPLEEAFALFTPEGERCWVEGWEPRYLHPADGRMEVGTVFTTAVGGEETVWMVSAHDPRAGHADYVRLTPGSRLGLVRVRCERLAERRTRVHVGYEMTALGETGNAAVRTFADKPFEAVMRAWSEAIERLLAARATDSPVAT